MEYEVGDIVKLKKPHPCGSQEWEILRVGADFRLKCLGCGHMVKARIRLYNSPFCIRLFSSFPLESS